MLHHMNLHQLLCCRRPLDVEEVEDKQMENNSHFSLAFQYACLNMILVSNPLLEKHSRCTGLATSKFLSNKLDGPEFHLDATVGMEDPQLGNVGGGGGGVPRSAVRAAESALVCVREKSNLSRLLPATLKVFMHFNWR